MQGKTIEIAQATIRTTSPAHCHIHVSFEPGRDRPWHPDAIPVTAQDILGSVEQFIGRGTDQSPTGTVTLWTHKEDSIDWSMREDLQVVRSD